MANRNVARAVRLALIAAGTASAGVYAPGVLAQDTELEQIVVTGSRIQRPDYESASPVVTVSEQLFDTTASTTVESVINTLPQFVPSVTSTSNNPSNGGQANVSLRGLGTVRTLVLVDGKRVIPANQTGVVDLNMIPSSLIQNVEILTGGASAVYGSDAVAGVVNFKLRDDMEGLEVDAGYGITGQGDAAEWSTSLTGGMKFADGRGHVMGNVTYAERDAVLLGDRKYTEYALGYFGPGTGNVGFGDGWLASGSGTIEEGRVTGLAASDAAFASLFQKYGYAPGTVPKQSSFGFNTDGTVFTTGNNTAGSVANFRGTKDPILFNDRSYTYNFAPPNALQLPLERWTGFLDGSFEFGEHAELYGQAIYANYTVDTQLAPTPASSVFIPVTNPYNPADLRTLLASRTNPTANFSFAKRMTEMGPRISETEYDVYQVMAGVKGKAWGDWTYDIYAIYGENDITENQQGNLNRDKFEQLTFAADGGKALCGGFNPFGLGSISPECAAYVSEVSTNKTNIKMTVAEGSLSGALFSLPAGDLSTAFGVFYKKDESSFKADEILRGETSGAFGLPIRPLIAGFNASDNVEGDTDSVEYWAEFLVPILKDVPGAQALDLGLGYRYADYSTAGGVSSYKAELTWQPLDPLRIRGSYQRAVRAPNVYELYLPLVTNFPQINPPDPCAINSPERTGPNASQVRALCLAQGLPAALIDSYTYANDQVEGLSGGNPDLQEETADTYTVGLVFSSPWDGTYTRNLQASVDWYSIEIEDVISAIQAINFVANCYDPTYNPTFAADNYWCNFFERTDFNGEITNAAEVNANLASWKMTGIDFQLDWRFDLGPGMLGFNWLVSYLDSFEQVAFPGDEPSESAGIIGGFAGSYPEWKSSFNVGYTWGALGVNARWRYIDEMTDSSWQEPPDVYTVDAMNYFDLSGSYAVDEGMLEGLTLRVGIENLTDEEPPLVPTGPQDNTDPSQYDMLGKRYYINATYKF